MTSTTCKHVNVRIVLGLTHAKQAGIRAHVLLLMLIACARIRAARIFLGHTSTKHNATQIYIYIHKYTYRCMQFMVICCLLVCRMFGASSRAQDSFYGNIVVVVVVASDAQYGDSLSTFRWGRSLLLAGNFAHTRKKSHCQTA